MRGVRKVVGINWGSSNFRAYRLDDDAQVLDAIESGPGIAGLDREGMARQMAELAKRWPDAGPVYACGMIGSNIGWLDAGYVACPVALADLAGALRPASIAGVDLQIVPGLACTRDADGAPDIMRGEETELFGLLASAQLPATGVVALPGTHTKWVRMQDGGVAEFLTSMSGEIFDRLTAAGLLASVVDGPATASPAFFEGVHAGAQRALGLGALLFGARARVIRGELQRADGASYLRGVLIGADIADARVLFPRLGDASVPLVGAAPVVELYGAAMAVLGLASHGVESRNAIRHGFVGLDRLRQACPA